ncbi:hypothetical protein N183_36205 [Sinorhizobium sp. Sb3]|nr:hypothetical protein N183_36205 [Sinorhizobium sp. Sb3]
MGLPWKAAEIVPSGATGPRWLNSGVYLFGEFSGEKVVSGFQGSNQFIFEVHNRSEGSNGDTTRNRFNRKRVRHAYPKPSRYQLAYVQCRGSLKHNVRSEAPLLERHIHLPARHCGGRKSDEWFFGKISRSRFLQLCKWMSHRQYGDCRRAMQLFCNDRSMFGSLRHKREIETA